MGQQTPLLQNYISPREHISVGIQSQKYHLVSTLNHSKILLGFCNINFNKFCNAWWATRVIWPQQTAIKLHEYINEPATKLARFICSLWESNVIFCLFLWSKLDLAMNLPWVLFGVGLLLVLNANVEGKRSHERRTKNADGSQSKRSSLKEKSAKELKEESKDDSSEITKRQFMYRPLNAGNYPVMKPPPIRHFVVHHHAS